MPGDGLSFAIRVSREDQFIRFLGRCLEPGDHLGLGGGDLVDLLEIVLHINDGHLFAPHLHGLFGGEVPDMAHGGHDLVALP